MKYVRFIERFYPATSYHGSGEVYVNDKCVGKWSWDAARKTVNYEHPCCHHDYLNGSMSELATKIVNSGWFDSKYDYYKGAFHYYFDPDEGYKHIENYERCFPLYAEYLITVE